ncbi:SRPBCC family protein [Pinibacter soli]|uniref:SRPBCC family protein n=1 Tax=Pinibacter soli TaxID=3044211 RepID=A0ABT6RD60_9BACT|nr:SRPBCC family protein [Pinibacter soli]MDI3320416.1 SRPBCC family protein [Pinibacter soli]
MDQKRSHLTVEVLIEAPLAKVWKSFTNPEAIKQWNNASPDWHTPAAQNDLRKGGSFSYRMEAKDGSFGFDFGGVYDEVVEKELIEYTMGDGRTAKVLFKEEDGQTEVVETFEAEEENSLEMQQAGWQAILDNFKNFVEKQ